jgi:hypothetical protein
MYTSRSLQTKFEADAHLIGEQFLQLDPECGEALTFWHRNFILHTLYIKCKNTGPKKGKIMKQTAF